MTANVGGALFEPFYLLHRKFAQVTVTGRIHQTLVFKSLQAGPIHLCKIIFG